MATIRADSPEDHLDSLASLPVSRRQRVAAGYGSPHPAARRAFGFRIHLLRPPPHVAASTPRPIGSRRRAISPKNPRRGRTSGMPGTAKTSRIHDASR